MNEKFENIVLYFFSLAIITILISLLLNSWYTKPPVIQATVDRELEFCKAMVSGNQLASLNKNDIRVLVSSCLIDFQPNKLPKYVP